MAWEDRNGRYYYYRKRREGKRVISVYGGSGLFGQIAEDIDLAERAEIGQARAVLRIEREKVERIEQQIGMIERNIRAITRAVLLVAGYHPHKRQWRKYRNG